MIALYYPQNTPPRLGRMPLSVLALGAALEGEWSDIDFITYAGYWINESERQYVERFKFYTKPGTERSYATALTKPLQMLTASRIKRDYYGFPIEKELVSFLRYKVLHQVSW